MKTNTQLKARVKKTNSLEELFTICNIVGYKGFENMNKEILRSNLIKFIG